MNKCDTPEIMGTFAHEYSYTKSLDVWRQQINVETYLEDPDQYERWWKLVFIFFKYYFITVLIT